MSFTSAIVAIVAIIAWAYLRSTRESRLGPRTDLRDALPANPALEREVVELRKRVEVLERILTDGRDASRLAQDIEALREH
ncbi:hypothetical protein [Novosphingobium sp. NDB2Meth1]|uniref:hypothetical protein n=1 Tax=Novosphingobium sp. NDB2Meth1 TaxID=1892847 RepID=UPI000930D5D3|nr:hypothetical protein [Novosphingobium sp. NDB2Meth1]